MEKSEYEHYIEKYKEHEKNRTSTNERQEYWIEYNKNKKNLDHETGFDMNRF